MFKQNPDNHRCNALRNGIMITKPLDEIYNII